MSKILFLFLLNITPIILAPQCTENVNNCLKCHPLTNLCLKCEYDVYSPDENGGCTGSKICTPGKNFCTNCNSDSTLCTECESGFLPDENGACSFTKNCEISLNGLCLNCINDFILIGDSYKFCKSLYSSDLLHCKTINKINGLCEECENNYYLNSKDKHCTETENCNEATFGVCTQCINGYYLEKINDKCIKQSNQFLNCKISIDGKNCDTCDDNYFFDENLKCTYTNFCSQTDNYNNCIKCIDNYFLIKNSDNTFSCTNEKNCINADKETGLCEKCANDFYLDLADRLCKSNKDTSEFNYCKKVNGNYCEECVHDYFLDQNGKCVFTQNCEISNNGICIKCKDNFYLGLDGKCSNIEKCVYSTFGMCNECEDGYVVIANVCEEIKEDKFKGCKMAYSDGLACIGCKKDYYLNYTDNLCYDNSDKNNYYKCAFVYLTYCETCVENYYLAKDDNKCTKVQNCKKSLDENTCTECKDYYCLNIKNNTCIDNEIIINNEEKFYYTCKKTNKEGTKCEICEDEKEINENGLCIDNEVCEEKDENGNCIKCGAGRTIYKDLCLNNVFGCVETYAKNCLRCDDLSNFDSCTECKEGYHFNEVRECVEDEN